VGVVGAEKIHHGLHPALSKGMKMKFAIAMALSHNPDLIILDEPTAGLDPVFRREMLDILQEIIQDENKSVFFSTHITTDLDQVADYITFINNGEIVFSKEKDIIFEEYFLLKGPDSLASEVPKVKTVGGRKTGVGFEALVKGLDQINQQLLSQLHVERPSLETIMYYTIRGNLL